MADPTHIKRAPGTTVLYDPDSGFDFTGTVMPFPTERYKKNFARTALAQGKLLSATEEEYEDSLPPPPPDPGPPVELSLDQLTNVDLTNANPDDALVQDEEGVWRPKAISTGPVEQPAIEIVGYDSYEGGDPYTFDIDGVQEGDIALLARIVGNTANGFYSTISTGFTNLGSSAFGGDFGIAYKFCQDGETIQVDSSGPDSAGWTSCGLIVVRNAQLASSSVGSERWQFGAAAPQATAPAGSLDVMMGVRRMNTPPAGWVPRNIDVPGAAIATKAYVNETALNTEYMTGGAYEYNGGGRALFTLPD